MGRPDFGRAGQQARQIAQFVGETAVLRTQVAPPSSSPYGMGSEATYVRRTVTALFQAVVFAQNQWPGGQTQAGDVIATVFDVQPGRYDEVLWSGTTYRVESDSEPQSVVGRAAWRVLLRRGGDY